MTGKDEGQEPKPKRDFVDWATLLIGFAGLAILIGTTIQTQFDQAESGRQILRALNDMDNLSKATQAQVNEARDEKRAWLSFELTPVKSDLGSTNLTYYVDAKIKNVGRQPALHVRTQIVLVAKDRMTDKILATDVKAVCKIAATKSFRESTNALFPDQQVVNHEATISGIGPWVDQDDKYILGCIAYFTPGSKALHETQVIYLVTDAEKDTPNKANFDLMPDASPLAEQVN